jgi:hypothetical protein
MMLRLIAAALAAIGLPACSPERDATSDLPLPVLSSPLAAAQGAGVASERPAARSKEEAGRQSH